MRYRVQVRFDPKTGVFPEFVVDAVDADPSTVGHDDQHELFARWLAEELDLDAAVVEQIEIEPNAEAVGLPPVLEGFDGEVEVEREGGAAEQIGDGA